MIPTIQKIGFWSGIGAFTFTIFYIVVQLLQIWDVVVFPLDEILIYGSSLGIVIPFILEMVALHHLTPGERTFWSLGALVFSIFYGVFVVANYVVQLATVIPLKISGAVHEVGILEQTPHSMFWNYDALGYIFMGLSNLLAVPVFQKSGIQKLTRGALIANAAVTPLISVVYFYPEYSEKLLMLGYPWAITAPLAMLTLALAVRKMPS